MVCVRMFFVHVCRFVVSAWLCVYARMYYDTILHTQEVQIAWPGYNILCTHTPLYACMKVTYEILACVVAHSIHAHIHVHTLYIHAHTLHIIHSQ